MATKKLSIKELGRKAAAEVSNGGGTKKKARKKRGSKKAPAKRTTRRKATRRSASVRGVTIGELEKSAATIKKAGNILSDIGVCVEGTKISRRRK